MKNDLLKKSLLLFLFAGYSLSLATPLRTANVNEPSTGISKAKPPFSSGTFSGSRNNAGYFGIILDDPAFECTDGVTYQVTSSSGDTGSSLYAFNSSTGMRTLIVPLPFFVNSLIYSSVDNLLWATKNNTNTIVKINAIGGVTEYPIANLPAPVRSYNVGVELPDGYMMIYETSEPEFYVVDVNPARPTYLQLVNPANGYTALTGPAFGIPVNGDLPVADIAFLPHQQLAYGLSQNGTLYSLNPFSGNVTANTSVVNGLSGGNTYGAVFADATGMLYAFENNTGNFYRINILDNTATYLSNSIASGNNDGANCPNTILDDPEFQCTDGVTYQVAASGGDTGSSLYEYNASTGNRTLIASLPHFVNSLVYNSTDNKLWATKNHTNTIVRINATGGVTEFPITNLPAPFSSYNVGVALPDGYMMIYETSEPEFYVVDVNAARPTYLQLVNPGNGYTALTGPAFGIPVNGDLPVADIAFLPHQQLAYGLSQNGTLYSLNPFNGDVNAYSTAVNGLSGGITYGAVFADITGMLYAFENNTGKFYRINILDNTATYLSGSISSGNNDGANCPNIIINDPEFECTEGMTYQVAASGGDTGSSLYEYNVTTGDRNLITVLPYLVNSLIYNSTDNKLWATKNHTNTLLRINAAGGTTEHSVTNLPPPFSSYNVGVELPDGYMMIYETSRPEFYVVDVNVARPTYLQLVDPANGYTALAGPAFGIPVNGDLPVADIAFSPNLQMLYGLSQSGTLYSLSPFTGNVTANSTPVNGLSGGNTYGAIFADATGMFYAFENTTGNFYQINSDINSATLLSTSLPSGNNDGANCVTSIICDTDITAPDNLSVCTENTGTFSTIATSSGASPLSYQWQVSTDAGENWSALQSGSVSDANGTYEGATTPDLIVTPATTAWKGNLYRVIVLSGLCTSTSSEAALAVYEPSAAPLISAPGTLPPCPITTFDLTALITSSTPLDNELVFYTTSVPSAQSLVADPTTVAEGTYYAFYQNPACISPASSVITVECSLPVTLVSFDVLPINEGRYNTVQLTWKTTAESNSDHFEIEKSADVKEWRKIRQISARGESQELYTYRFVDTHPVAGSNYYRLRMTDRDASYTYSHIEVAEFGNKEITFYPNPVSDIVFIKDTDSNTLTEASIIDGSGNALLTTRQVSASGIDVSNLSAGLYFVKLTNKSGIISTYKIIIAR